MNLPEDGLIKSKHVGECKLQYRTMYISCVKKKTQLVWIIQMRIQSFLMGGGGGWPWGYVKFTYDFKNYVIKIMSYV
jgi:hypothetical protein